MFPSRQFKPIQSRWQPLSVILPVLAACLAALGSGLPWLADPLGDSYSAWMIPLDIGWQVRTSLLNYGELCLCGVIYTSLVACAHWSSAYDTRYRKCICYFEYKYTSAAFLLALPPLLFLLQQLCIDLPGMALLARHETQQLLIAQHLSYRITDQRITLTPFTLNAATLWGRGQLLLDQMAPGVGLPCLGAWLLFESRRFIRPQFVVLQKTHWPRWLICLALLSGIILTGRGFAVSLCDMQAKNALTVGNYALALRWLDDVAMLNPALVETSDYHIKRGEALYFLHPGQVSDDSRTYLASTYRMQGDYLDAYQEILAVWQTHRTTAWVVDEMTLTLEQLIESVDHPLSGSSVRQSDNGDRALSWVQLLVKVDPSNVYGQYLIGRIQYDLHNYTVCNNQMMTVLALSINRDIQSSAYTYMALSAAGQGKYAASRELLFKAVQLDGNYRNNTAREELSGLH